MLTAIILITCLSILLSCSEISDNGYDSDWHINKYGISFAQPNRYDRKYYFDVFFGSSPCEILISDDFLTQASQEKCDDIVKKIYTRLDLIDRCLSTSIAGSDINRFNLLSFGQQIEVNKLTADMIELAKQTNEWTSGAYEPAAYYIIDLWGNAPRVEGSSPMPYDQLTANLINSKLPVNQRLSEDFYFFADEFMNAFSIQDVEVIKSDDRYYLKKNAQPLVINYKGTSTTYQLKLDLGGIGKGYAADEVERIVRENDYKYGWVNIGGSSLQLFQRRPTEKDSSIIQELPIKNPRWDWTQDDSTYDYAVIPVMDTATSTSGDYEQFRIIDGIRYCHIVDNTTGKPVDTGIMTVTISNLSSAAEADALTTAIMVMGLDKAIEFINSPLFKLREINVVFVYEPDNSPTYQVITNNASGLSIVDANKSKFIVSSVIDDNGNIVVQPPQDYTLVIIILIACVIVLAVLLLIWAYPKLNKKFKSRNTVILARNSKPFVINDIFVYLSVAIVIVVLFTVFVFTAPVTELEYINLYSNGEMVYKFDCNSNIGAITQANYSDRVTVSINDGIYLVTVYESSGSEHYNTVEIKPVNGKYQAKITQANCSNTKECVNNFPSIKSGNGIIICTVHNFFVVGVDKNQSGFVNPSIT